MHRDAKRIKGRSFTVALGSREQWVSREITRSEHVEGFERRCGSLASTAEGLGRP
jgi:hypothetical protein